MSDQRPPVPGAAGAGDPSMEDILASIRRILNEDEPGTPAPADTTPEPLVLTEDMLVQGTVEVLPEPVATPAPAPEPPPAEPPPAEPIQAQPIQAEPTAAPPGPAEPPPAEPVPTPPLADVEALLAPAVAAAATAAIGNLLRAVSQERTSAVTRGGPSIEDVVREEVRPLLKEWLDQHLPAVVERLVRSEIERVVGRALS